MLAHPVADIFPLLVGEAFDALVADIKANGLRTPIVTLDGKILDGRNRWRACEAAGARTRTVEFDGDDPLGFVLSENLHRRHLNAGQLAQVALKVEAIEAVAAAERRRATQNNNAAKAVVATLPQQDEGRAREKAAKATGASPRNVQKAKHIAANRPDLAEKVATGALSLNAAERQAKEDDRKAELQRPVEVVLAPWVHHGDFRDLSASIPDASVELVFTDPPYDEKSVDLYRDAAKVAARILKPGGSFIAYSGQRHLPQVLAGCSEHLRYWWTIAGVHSGGNQILQKLGIRCGWKPLVWFVKDTRGDVQEVLLDVVTGEREKGHHEWQQAEAEAMYYIEKLTSPSGIVVDFFLGGGTTAVACKKLGRQYIGFEVSADSAEKASQRILSVEKVAA